MRPNNLTEKTKINFRVRESEAKAGIGEGVAMNKVSMRLSFLTDDQKTYFWETALALWRANARVVGVQRAAMLMMSLFCVFVVIVLPQMEFPEDSKAMFTIFLQIGAVLSIAAYGFLGRAQTHEQRLLEQMIARCIAFGVDRELLEDGAAACSEHTPSLMRFFYRRGRAGT